MDRTDSSWLIDWGLTAIVACGFTILTLLVLAEGG